MDETDIDHVALIESSFLFDRDWYVLTYSGALASGSDPLQHYLLNGVADACNPNMLFDTRWYVSAYLELGAGLTNPLVHYILRGAELGCDPHPYFSTKEYLDRNPSARESKLTPLGYYLTHTIFSEPSTFPRFSPYDVVKATEDNYRRLEAAEVASHIETMIIRPKFVVIVAGENDTSNTTIANLAEQQYLSFDVIASSTIAAQRSFEAEEEPQYVVWIEAGDILMSDALYRYASAINADPALDLIYFDYDYKVRDNNFTPVYKPGWSPDYLEATDYIGSGVCVRLEKARDALAAAQSRFDFILRFTELPISVAHIDRVLLSAQHPAWQPQHAGNIDLDIGALRGRLDRTKRKGSIKPRMRGTRCYDIKIELRHFPRVSIVIPTAAKVILHNGDKVDLVAQCVSSIFELTTYPDFELIIVDNGDFDRSRLAFVDRRVIKYISYRLEEVNIAKKINIGAAYATGQLVLILNDDVKVLKSEWLERLVAHFEKPHVGIVGAKLLYPDGTIQHAGVASCDGHPQHVSRGKPCDDEGYVFSTACVRNYIAVTGALMMTSAEAFAKVHGFSETFPIDFNDIEFCLKFFALQLSVIYEPGAALIHYESVSLLKQARVHDIENFHSRWGWIAHDPFYNESYLSKSPPSFDIVFSRKSY